MVTLHDIQEAARVLDGVAIKTPLIFSTSFSRRAGAQVYLKLENLQKTGSFKFRGAYHKLSKIRPQVSSLGVVAASAGNHAQGVAHAAQLLGVPATIVMPEWASISKQLATRGYGGRVILAGTSLTESLAQARTLEAEGRTFMHPYDDVDVIAGQGTIGLEIVAELPTVDAVLTPVGGGGLIAGIATAVKALRPETKMIGVQAAVCASALAARRLGKPTPVSAGKSIADGISVKEVGRLPFAVMERLVDDIVTVEEEQIATAVLDLLERKKVLAEGSGAVPLAALVSGVLPSLRDRVVVLVVSGGNVDSHLLGRILNQGLFRSGRILKFSVVLEDVPGALAGLLEVVATSRGNILHILHDRMGRHLPLGLSRVELEVETRDVGHMEEILNALTSSGYEVEAL
ncbi:MAG TPA: threonine ammonia-lyase [Syntrophobacteria bacterium]|nr:threonine ammonia-lyase [Syntrophobacteria bacterium]